MDKKDWEVESCLILGIISIILLPFSYHFVFSDKSSDITISAVITSINAIIGVFGIIYSRESLKRQKSWVGIISLYMSSIGFVISLPLVFFSLLFLLLSHAGPLIT